MWLFYNGKFLNEPNLELKNSHSPKKISPKKDSPVKNNEAILEQNPTNKSSNSIILALYSN